jgi:Sulfotransferase domain
MSQSKRRKIDKIDFIVAGAQKCGTTALHHFLEKHPNIALPDKQELHFFDNEDLFSKEVNYQLLHDSFRPTSRSLVVGESTPTYVYWRTAIERIWNYNKAIKLIILLRNPVLRAFSHWNMQRERGFDDLDFLDAVKEESNRQQEASPFQSRRFSYIDRGFYSEQVERVFRCFPREQVKVIKFEEFRKNQPAVLDSIFTFIGVKPLGKIRNKERNPIPYQREITGTERRYIYKLFRKDIARLEKLLGWDCSDWKE